MNTSQHHPLIEAMHMIGRAVRLLFSRRNPSLAQSMAVELARSTSMQSGLMDPVRSWAPPSHVDRGLGRARRLQRLVNSPVRHNANQQPSQDHAADYLFVAVMNLARKMPLSDEAHLFRLWYLATRAENPPENALRLFGELQDMPVHQQLAAGARMLFVVGSGVPEPGLSRPRLPTPHAVALPLPTRQALDCRLDDH